MIMQDDRCHESIGRPCGAARECGEVGAHDLLHAEVDGEGQREHAVERDGEDAGQDGQDGHQQEGGRVHAAGQVVPGNRVPQNAQHERLAAVEQRAVAAERVLQVALAPPAHVSTVRQGLHCLSLPMRVPAQ